MYTSVNVAVNGEVKMGGYRSSEHLIVPIGFESGPRHDRHPPRRVTSRSPLDTVTRPHPA